MATARYIRGEIRTVKYLAGADVAVDEIVRCGVIGGDKSRVGVARNAIANGEVGIVAISGIFDFPKVSGAVIKAGESVTWDNSAEEVDDSAATAASGDVAQFGIAVEDAGNGATTVEVDIDESGTYTA